MVRKTPAQDQWCGIIVEERRLQKVDIRVWKMLHPASRKSEDRRSWRISMKINGGESLKHKLGAEIRFQEEICRVDQRSGEIQT